LVFTITAYSQVDLQQTTSYPNSQNLTKPQNWVKIGFNLH